VRVKLDFQKKTSVTHGVILNRRQREELPVYAFYGLSPLLSTSRRILTRHLLAVF
jgi:hypothetical protein